MFSIVTTICLFIGVITKFENIRYHVSFSKKGSFKVRKCNFTLALLGLINLLKNLTLTLWDLQQASLSEAANMTVHALGLDSIFRPGYCYYFSFIKGWPGAGVVSLSWRTFISPLAHSQNKGSERCPMDQNHSFVYLLYFNLCSLS